MDMLMRESRNQLIYNCVYQIPEGSVATYGQIAQLCGLAGQARQVGYALSALQGNHDVPWHRVVNAKGLLSQRSGDQGDSQTLRQRRLLEAEGVCFSQQGVIDLGRYRWRPAEL